MSLVWFGCVRISSKKGSGKISGMIAIIVRYPLIQNPLMSKLLDVGLVNNWLERFPAETGDNSLPSDYSKSVAPRPPKVLDLGLLKRFALQICENTLSRALAPRPPNGIKDLGFGARTANRHFVAGESS